MQPKPPETDRQRDFLEALQTRKEHGEVVGKPWEAMPPSQRLGKLAAMADAHLDLTDGGFFQATVQAEMDVSRLSVPVHQALREPMSNLEALKALDPDADPPKPVEMDLEMPY